MSDTANHNLTIDALRRLEDILGKIGPIAVAVSGGVDSMTLAFVANRVNPDSQMFHALSPAVPAQATDRVRDYAERLGWQLNLIDAGEINDPAYLANPANRCYFCKTNLYDTVTFHTELTVVSGTNTDDLGDYRPGLIAAEEHDVRHPFVEAGISKEMLRGIAGYFELNDLRDLPAAPCLSSRVTTGIEIDADMLPVINDAEQALWEHLQLNIPVKGVRCRIRPDTVAIEIESPADIDDSADYAVEAQGIVRNLFNEAGYSEYTSEISIEPYERGSAFLIDTISVE